MNYLLLGLVFSLTFGFLLLILLNYTVVLWHSRRLEANNLRQTQWGGGLGNTGDGENKAKNPLYERALVALHLDNKNYPTWLIRLLSELDKFRHNSWQYLVSGFQHLLNLTGSTAKTGEGQKINPPKFSGNSFINKMTSLDQEEELEMEAKEEPKIVKPSVIRMQDKSAFVPTRAVKPTISTPAVTANAASVLNQKDSAREEKQHANFNSNANQDEQKVPLEGKSSATLNILSKNTDEDKPHQEISLFEKMEKRILSKLKDAGLGHYDIWLELGDLYSKYQEGEKAREVYSLILKHSNGKERDLARDRLIGLS